MELTKKIQNLIDKIPVIAGIVMLAVSITFASLYSSQETTMLIFMMTWGQSGMASETLGWWFYIMGGLIYFGLFELLMRVIIYFVRWQLPMLDRNTSYHYIRVIFSVNYLILGLFHLAYFFFPLLQVWGALFDFLVSSLFLYLAYHLISRKALPNFLWARALRAVAMVFFIYHGINVFLGLFTALGGVL
ncbi:MAG TPA: hypothetical protein GX745_04330 [Clostridiales bacterium]|nr:hypothetical protein [Clostridiales bacterium]